MEKLKKKIETSQKALKTFKNILKEPYSEITRDASIQRFEYYFEIIWKTVKLYLEYQEGIICNSPKSCFRELFSIGLIDENKTIKLLEMTDDRNLTSHTYDEKLAKELYNKLGEYYKLMEEILEKIKKHVK
ncbi:MAG: HI0074 family nucleotidyltransferase substrate-binding subunit [bacterium]